MRNFVVLFGRSAHWFSTNYHAEQFARALQLNGTPCRVLDYTEFKAERQAERDAQ